VLYTFFRLNIYKVILHTKFQNELELQQMDKEFSLHKLKGPCTVRQPKLCVAFILTVLDTTCASDLDSFSKKNK